MNKVLIVGNGFDLSAGLKTSYGDFINSELFTSHSGSLLFDRLKARYVKSKWVDIELFLKSYARCISVPSRRVDLLSGEDRRALHIFLKNDDHLDQATENFHEEYVSLKKALVDYLNDQDDLGKIDFKNGVDRYFSENHTSKKFNAVLTFNYTSQALRKVFSGCDPPDILHLHGSLVQNDVVFGVDDQVEGVSEEFLFLTKSDHASYGKFPSLKSIALESDEMHFFGLSFGETDDSHFRPLFEFLSSDDARIGRRLVARGVQTQWGGDEEIISSINRRKLHFYVNGRNGYVGIRNRLRHLVGQKVSELKLLNEVSCFDVSQSDVFKIDQNWLDEHSV